MIQVVIEENGDIFMIELNVYISGQPLRCQNPLSYKDKLFITCWFNSHLMCAIESNLNK